MKRTVALGAAAAAYVVAAWSVRPGFYDGPAAPNYAYVSPPPVVAAINVAPTSGSGTVGAAGGVVTTRDQPVAQAAVYISKAGLPGSTEIQIKPSAPPPPRDVTLTGNVYCFSGTNELAPGVPARIVLLLPVYQPSPDAMYFAASPDAFAWSSLGGSLDQSTFLFSAQTPSYGCFALGYKTPKPGSGPTIGGALLPAITAVLIAIVVLAGLPLAARRRRGRRE